MKTNKKLPGWMGSNPRKIDNAIIAIVNGDVKLKNPDFVLSMLNHVQSKLDSVPNLNPSKNSF